jgi:hypothetical protein
MLLEPIRISFNGWAVAKEGKNAIPKSASKTTETIITSSAIPGRLGTWKLQRFLTA